MFYKLARSFVLFIILALSFGVIFLKNLSYIKSELLSFQKRYTDQKNALLEEHPALFYSSIGQGPLSNKTSYSPQNKEPTGFTIDLGSFYKQEEAEKLIKELQEKGFSAYYTPYRKGTVLMFRVKTGFYSDELKARYAIKQLDQRIQHKGEITKL